MNFTKVDQMPRVKDHETGMPLCHNALCWSKIKTISNLYLAKNGRKIAVYDINKIKMGHELFCSYH